MPIEDMQALRMCVTGNHDMNSGKNERADYEKWKYCGHICAQEKFVCLALEKAGAIMCRRVAYELCSSR